MASSSDAAPETPPRLVRAIGRWDLTAAVINSIVGAAIFGMPATQAALTGAWSPGAYLLAGLGVLTVMLCFAEVASRFVDPGGPYLYAREAFGPAVGFQAGWLTFLVRATSVAANLNVMANYVAQVLPWAGLPAGRAALMGLLLVVVTSINIAGVRQATWAVDLFTAAKLLPFAVLIVLGLPRVDPAVLATQTVADPSWIHAILLLVYAYGGFESPLLAMGEVRDPRRDTAFALMMALAVVVVLYMLVQLVVVGVVPGVAAAKAPVAAAFQVLIGPAGVLFASLAAVVSISGWTMGSVLQAPRLLFSMADRRELPAVFARVHPRFRTPHVAIAAYSALAFGLALYGSFEWNATLSAVVRLVTYGLTCLALPVLRRRRPGEAPGFRLALAPLFVAAAVLFCVRLLLSQTFAQAWVVAALLGAGIALWLAASRRRARDGGVPPAGLNP